MESENEKSNEQDRIGAARMRFGEAQNFETITKAKSDDKLMNWRGLQR